MTAPDPTMLAVWEAAEQAQAERWRLLLDRAAAENDQSAAAAAPDMRSA